MSWNRRVIRFLRTVDRYLQTVRYLRLQQWLWRPYLRVRRWLYLNCRYLRTAAAKKGRAMADGLGLRSPGTFLDQVYWERTDGRSHLEIATRTARLEFTFLNQPVAFQSRIDWSCPDQSQLWRYNLYYQGYLVSLGIAHRLTGRPEYYAAFKDIITSWIEANPAPFGDGWHPYVVSLRAANWISAWHLFSGPLAREPEVCGRLRESLAGQIAYVAENLELDVGGNHLLENVKALCLAGAFFTGPAAGAWLNLGLRLLANELKRQVLPDGGHYERSPMYHAIVLEGLLIVAAALKNAGIPWPDGLRDALIRMVRFLEDTVHPDGQIALFNDSAFGIAPEPRYLLGLARGMLGSGDLSSDAGVPVKMIACYDSGYFGARNGDCLFLLDAGPVCPDDLPAHAHSDIFSYELSIRGRRWVVDSGVSEYRAGDWRDYARSTRAHNTVSLSGLNQVDVWSSFRVGRRVRPVDVSIRREPGAVVIAGRHYGFGRRRPHARIAVDLDDETWIIIDEVSGTGPVAVENFIHLHPEAAVDLSGEAAMLSLGGVSARLLVAGHDRVECLSGQVQPLNGWYMPEFGLSRPNPTIVIQTRFLPSLTAYVLTTCDDVTGLRLDCSEGRRRCVLSRGSEEVTVAWDASGAPELKYRRS